VTRDVSYVSWYRRGLRPPDSSRDLSRISDNGATIITFLA
jgi:hypothetical protein